MATTVIWQNPLDANDRIEYNDDNTNAEYYRFRIDTGFELTLTRDATNSRTILSVSGSTWPGIIELNANGEIWSKGDLKLKLDSDGGGTNKLTVQGSSGTVVLEVDEDGNVALAGDYSYRTARSKSLNVCLFSQMPYGNSTSPDLEEMVFWSKSGSSGITEYLRARSQTTPYQARAMIPVKLPNGSVIYSMDIFYRKTAQAVNKQRNLATWFWVSAAFGSTGSPASVIGPEVSNGDGTTTGSTKSVTFTTPIVVNNQTNAYGVYVDIINTDTGNDGPDGLGVGGIRLNYTLQKLEVY